MKKISYLEFGAQIQDSLTRDVYDFRSGDQAYEWLMHSRYSNDIYAYEKMKQNLDSGDYGEIANIYSDSVHHRNDFVFNLNKYIALSLFSDSFFELGHTLFGCIDAMEFCQRLVEQLAIDIPSPSLADIDWYGVDISEFFNFFRQGCTVGID